MSAEWQKVYISALAEKKVNETITVSPRTIECLNKDWGKMRVSGARLQSAPHGCYLCTALQRPSSRLYTHSPSHQGQTTSFSVLHYCQNIVWKSSCRLCKNATCSISQLVRIWQFAKPAADRNSSSFNTEVNRLVQSNRGFICWKPHWDSGTKCYKSHPHKDLHQIFTKLYL